jgi:hypothetical protein
MLGQARQHTVRLARPAPRVHWRGHIEHLVREWDLKLLIGLSFLIAVDIGFVATYSVHEIYNLLHKDDATPIHFRWRIGADHSYAEFFGYAKALAVVALLISAHRLSSKWMYSVWAGVFAYVVLDDALLIHERLGRALAGPSSSDWEWDMGQLATWGVVGLALLAITVASLVRSSGQERTNGVLLLATLLALGFFAVAIDLAHVLFRASFTGASQVFTVIEEGGEQLVLSLAVALTALIRRRKRRSSALPLD